MSNDNGKSEDVINLEEREARFQGLYAQQQLNVAKTGLLEAFNTVAGDFRRRFMSMFSDRRRNIESECGYPQTEELSVTDYKNLYEREPLARRVVDILPKSSWEVQPRVYESDDPDKPTEFDKALDELTKGLQGPGFFKDDKDEGSVVWSTLERLDKLSGIGRYGVLLIGTDDKAESMSEPLPMSSKENTEPVRKVLFLKALDESQVEIKSFNTEEKSPRYGLPELYTVDLSEDESLSGRSGPNTSSPTKSYSQSIEVHWSRILHVLDNKSSSDTFGEPRMQVVYNRLYDLHKLYGASAEMYWLAAFFGLSIELHPDLADTEVDKEAMRQQMENYQNSLQRYITLQGMSAKTLSPTVVDPSNHIDKQVEAICIQLDVPKRIFMGSERGELSSGQDSRKWIGTLKHRQSGHITPNIIVPFIDRLILIGVLPTPETYSVSWDDIGTKTDDEKADVGLKRTDMIAKYVQGGGESLVEPIDFLTRFVGLDQEEAQAIIDARIEAMGEEGEDESLDSPLLSLVGGITGMQAMVQSASEGGIPVESLSVMLKIFFGLDDKNIQAIVDPIKPVNPEVPGLPFIPEEEEKPEASDGTEEEPEKGEDLVSDPDRFRLF